MEYMTVDLYRQFRRERPAHAAGTLTCILPAANEAVNPDRRRPAMLVLPGGGYAHLSPREGEPVALRYAAAGFCAFVLEYAVAPALYPTAFLEAAMAMAYIRQNADSLGVDPTKVAAIGFSAGGHLCGCLATLFGEPLLAEALGDAAPELVRPDAVVLSYAVLSYPSHTYSYQSLCGEDEALKQFLSLEERVTTRSAPAFLWHTGEDQSVPVESSLRYAGACHRHGVPFSLHIYETGRHGLSNGDFTVYTAQTLPKMSRDLPGWVDLSLHWLWERGFLPRDD